MNAVYVRKIHTLRYMNTVYVRKIHKRSDI